MENGDGTRSNFRFGSMGGYMTYEEVVAELDRLRSLHPNIISAKESIGTSLEGRDIWMVRVSDNPSVDEDEPEILSAAALLLQR